MRTESGSEVANKAAMEVPEDLVLRLVEIIKWRKSGVADLPALQAYADAKLPQLADMDTLRIAEDKTLMEAAHLIVAIAGKSHD
jgi:hypothetical protein